MNENNHLYDGTREVPDSVSNLTVQDGVKAIGLRAFFYCDFVSVHIPDTVEKIGYGAFGHCHNLVSIKLPSSIKEIDDGAFSHCRSLSSIDLPPSVKHIGKAAFAYCNSLTSVIIPSSLKIIEDGAFKECTSLTSINLPLSIQKIGRGAFEGCSSLTTIQPPSQLTALEFKLELSGVTSVQSAALPLSLKYIDDRAFNGCKSLTSITLPSDIEWIGTYAFRGCKSLQIVNLQSNINPINQNNHTCSLKDFENSNEEAIETPCIFYSILPLHFNLMFGSFHYYYDEIFYFIKTDPTNLTTCDPIFNLYPFLLAACAPRWKDYSNNKRFYKEIQHLETVFILLRQAPWVMDILIRQKRSHFNH